MDAAFPHPQSASARATSTDQLLQLPAERYFPPPEAEGGWRLARSPDEIRAAGGLDPRKLALAEREQEWLFGGNTWAVSIIRNGVLAAEFRTFSAHDQSRFDVWSVTKSMTSLAFGILFGDSRRDSTAVPAVTLDSPAYDFIPEGHPLTDERKRLITVRHLLTMTSGFLGYIRGVAFGVPTAFGDGLFEAALGRIPSRYGYSFSSLIGDPGTLWEYSDPGFAHLSLVFAHAARQEIDDFLNARLFGPLGIPQVSWSRAGGGSLIGPHTLSHTGLVLSARELARVGYLLLRGGRWHEREVVPLDWIELATIQSQDFNPHYGYAFWTNSGGTLWPEAPADAFAMMGFHGNRCWVVPSLDLVIARTGTGPPIVDDRYFPVRVLDAVL